jgi:hypothetical protein
VNRFFVPAVLAATISGLGLGLVVGIVARSPDTHSNVRPEGYSRTPIAYVGDDVAFVGLGLADPDLLLTGDPAQRGGLLFLGAGCATCHGLSNQGGVIGPELDLGDLTPADFRRAVRSGPSGMPAFLASTLPDADLEAIYAYLDALRRGASSSLTESRLAK